MQTAKCIESDSLLLFINGKHDEKTAEIIRTHLTECSSCEFRLSSLRGGDSEDNMLDLGSIGGVVSDLEAEDFDNIQNIIDHATNILPGQSLQETDLGNYRLHCPVGQGGMAVVYKAENKKLQKTVAVKILRTGFHGPPLQRIEREIKAHGKLNHPSIVTAVDAGEEGSIQYLVTEFVDGLDLGNITKSIGSLPVADACEIIRQAAMGIESAHQLGMIHRDLKPSNIMINSQGQVKVLDFGLVHFQQWSESNLELTSVGQLLGTLDYMAPEQAENPASVGLQCDIYSLAATLFCLLTGQAPLAGTGYQSPIEKLRKIATSVAPKVTELRSGIPNSLCKIIANSLSNSPADRPVSAKSFAESLQPFCEGHQLQTLISTAQSKSSSDTLSISNLPLLASSSNLWISSDSPTLTMDSRRGGSIWKNVILGLSLFAVFAFSIVLLIQTNRGQIVIEVPDETVQVEVVSSGKTTQELTLKPGANSIQLFAGTYQIKIKEKPDRYEIDGDKIILGRGKTVLAKITKKPIPPKNLSSKKPANEDTFAKSLLAGQRSPSNSSNNIASKSASYRKNQPNNPSLRNAVEGKNIQHWLSVMIHEQNADLVNKAIEAIRDLSEPETDFMVRKAITQTLVQAKSKLKPMRTDRLRIYEPFDKQQLKQIDRAIMDVEPDLGIIILEIKAKLIADQLLDDFDTSRYVTFHLKTNWHLLYNLEYCLKFCNSLLHSIHTYCP